MAFKRDWLPLAQNWRPNLKYLSSPGLVSCLVSCEKDRCVLCEDDLKQLRNERCHTRQGWLQSCPVDQACSRQVLMTELSGLAFLMFLSRSLWCMSMQLFSHFTRVLTFLNSPNSAENFSSHGSRCRGKWNLWMPSVPGPPSARTEGDGAVCAPGRVSSDLHTFGFDVNVTSVSGVTEQKTTGRTDKAETLSLSWKKHHQLAGKLRKLFWKVISENILLLRDLSSIYWESASWRSFRPQHTMWVCWRVLPHSVFQCQSPLRI